MKAMSGSNLVRRPGFARLLSSALLLTSIACSVVTGRGGAGLLNVEKGLKAPPGNDEETRKYFNNRVHFSIWDSDVEGHFKQQNGTAVRIKVKPEKTTHNRSWHQSRLSAFGEGLIVGRIENVDKKNVSELGLTANDEFAHIWIGPLPSSRRGIAFYVFDKQGNAIRKGDLELDSFKFCPDYPGNQAEAKFRKDHGTGPCEDVPGSRASPARSTASAQLISLTRKPARPLWIGGLWISCSGGCCDVGGGMFE